MLDLMKDVYLFDIMNSHEILLPHNESLVIGRGMSADYRTLVRFPEICLEQMLIEYRDPGDIHLTNLDTSVSLYAGTDVEPFGREITNREQVFLGEFLTVAQTYQFRLYSEKDFKELVDSGVPGRSCVPL